MPVRVGNFWVIIGLDSWGLLETFEWRNVPKPATTNPLLKPRTGACAIWLPPYLDPYQAECDTHEHYSRLIRGQRYFNDHVHHILIFGGFTQDYPIKPAVSEILIVLPPELAVRIFAPTPPAYFPRMYYHAVRRPMDRPPETPRHDEPDVLIQAAPPLIHARGFDPLGSARFLSSNHSAASTTLTASTRSDNPADNSAENTAENPVSDAPVGAAVPAKSRMPSGGRERGLHADGRCGSSVSCSCCSEASGTSFDAIEHRGNEGFHCHFTWLEGSQGYYYV